jgi:hypothetical protein
MCGSKWRRYSYSATLVRTCSHALYRTAPHHTAPHHTTPHAWTHAHARKSSQGCTASESTQSERRALWQLLRCAEAATQSRSTPGHEGCATIVSVWQRCEFQINSIFLDSMGGGGGGGHFNRATKVAMVQGSSAHKSMEIDQGA